MVSPWRLRSSHGTAASARIIAITPDAASRLTTVTDWDSNVTSYSYDNAGRMTLVELPNGVETSYTYDDGDRLTDIEHMLGMSTLAFVNYTLDNVGNRTQRVDGQGTHVYAYDDVYRLTSVTYPGPSTTSYVYDAFGNRASMTVGANTTTYTYDDNDRITSVTPPSASPIAYSWDDNGNLEDRGSDEFIWDYEDRLVETTVNSVTTEFAYRGDGLRDSRTVGMNTTTFTWDIAAGIPVVLDDGNRYIYGAHGLIAQVEGSDWYYFLSDGLGSTMAITDDVGTVVRDYTYDVFGEVTGGSGTVDAEFQFAGEQVDGSTGLQYLRARYYDMESGTFISRDSMAAGPGWLEHPFAYASANPANLTDPLGLCSWRKPWECADNAGGWFKDRWDDVTDFADAVADWSKGVVNTAVDLLYELGEKGKRLAEQLASFGKEWLSDPLNSSALALAAASILAQLACAAAVTSLGTLTAGCIAAGGLLMGTAAARAEVLRQAVKDGRVSEERAWCEGGLDIAAAYIPAPPFVQILRLGVGSHGCSAAFGGGKSR